VTFKLEKVVLFVILVLIFTSSFAINVFGVAPANFFDGFQSDSEALVYGKIAADNLEISSHKFGLGSVASDGNAFQPYESQYGLQGRIFSTLHNDLKLGIPLLKVLACLILTVTLLGLACFYRTIISFSFSIIFLLTVFLSPWVVSFARNLYWVTFTWFLPALCSVFYFKAKTVASRRLGIFLVFGAFFVKCLSGYEYLSSVILFATAPSVYLLVLNKGGSRKKFLSDFLNVTLVGVFAFVIAFCLHAGMRGENFIDGLRVIYEQDVKRRTFGNPSNFPPVYAASLAASPVAVLKMYVWGWTTDIIAFLPGRSFPILCALMAAVLVYRALFQKKYLNPDLALVLAFLPVPISWFVLAKSHSFIHTHINFVMWYLGFMAVLFTVIFSGVKILFFRAIQWARIVKIEEV
jgi:hypothetical protein